jgi:predicted molibdopterin-dependent oxidoreductase YjgC
MGLEFPRASAREIFLEMSRVVEAFAGMTYESVGDIGQLLS